MRNASTSSQDPALQRLHEVADRIRLRSSAGLPLPRSSRPVAPVLPAPVSPAPPPHWADDPDGDDRH